MVGCFFSSLPGVKKSLGKYGPASVEDTTGSAAADAKDDDDIDLFGSDDEEVWLTSLSEYNDEAVYLQA